MFVSCLRGNWRGDAVATGAESEVMEESVPGVTGDAGSDSDFRIETTRASACAAAARKVAASAAQCTSLKACHSTK